MVISGLIFPVVQSWTDGDGFLSQNGYIDSMNSSGTYLVGSLVGFVGNCIIGPRYTFYKHKLSKLATCSKKLRKVQDNKNVAKSDKTESYNYERDQSDSEFVSQTENVQEDDVDADNLDLVQFMTDIKLKFPELKPLNQREIISVLNMYDNHMQ